MTAQTIYFVPQAWQLEMYHNPSDYILETMSNEEWYHMVMFELYEPDNEDIFWETHHHYPFGSKEHFEYMMETYGVLSFTQHPIYAPIIFQKIRDTMSKPKWKKWFHERRSKMYNERYDSDFFQELYDNKIEIKPETERDYNFRLSKEEIQEIRQRDAQKTWEMLRNNPKKLCERNNKISKQQSITSTSDEYRERNTYECDLCGQQILKLGNLRQHRNGIKCKKRQSELQASD